jgi:hypothetical protein
MLIIVVGTSYVLDVGSSRHDHSLSEVTDPRLIRDVHDRKSVKPLCPSAVGR